MSDQKEEFYCQKCRRHTNHDLLYDESVSITASDGSTTWKVYDTIRCRGCDTIAFHYSECVTQTSDPHSRLLLAKSQYYPRDRFFRVPIEGTNELPGQTRTIYFEVLSSLNEELPILTAIGIRSLIESICREKTYSWKNLYKGIEALGVNGILSFTEVEFLHACRFLGNNAAHEIIAPSKDQLLSALDIVETLLKSIYVLPCKAKSIEGQKKEGT